jgi:hypothetical protein
MERREVKERGGGVCNKMVLEPRFCLNIVDKGEMVKGDILRPTEWYQSMKLFSGSGE